MTGTEQIFAAGADIKEMVERGPAGTSNNPLRVAAWRKLERFPKPIIAAVNGIAFGAGASSPLLVISSSLAPTPGSASRR